MPPGGAVRATNRTVGHGPANRTFTVFGYTGAMSKKALIVVAVLIAGDAVLLHGHYRTRVAQEAAMVEYSVDKQSWSTPLVDTRP